MNYNRYAFNEYYNIRDSSELPGDEVEEIATCIASAFGGTITHEDAHNHMAGDKVVVVHQVTPNGIIMPEVAGFSSTIAVAPSEKFDDVTMMAIPGAYLEGVAIAENHQGQGLFRQLIDNYLDYSLSSDAEFLFTRTQNPKVMSGISSGLERAIESDKLRHYRLDIGLARAAYGRMLTATKPETKGTIFDTLDYDVGDAYVLTWFRR